MYSMYSIILILLRIRGGVRMRYTYGVDALHIYYGKRIWHYFS